MHANETPVFKAVNSYGHIAPTETVDRQTSTPQTLQQSLLQSQDLAALLSNDPKLRAQLRRIYEATREPLDEPRHQGRRSRNDGPWTEEKGTKLGIEAWRGIREEGGEGLEKFLNLVQRLDMEGNS
jgi:hypothetical protein